MDLMSAVAAPTLYRGQDEIGLIPEAFGATGLDRFESALGCGDDTAVWAGTRDEGDGLDDAEVSIIVYGVAFTCDLLAMILR